jgi:nitroreductase
MGEIQRAGDGGGDLHYFISWHASRVPLPQQATAIGPVHIVHGDPQLAVELAPVVQADDLGVKQVAARSASRLNRSRNSRSPVTSAGRILSASRRDRLSTWRSHESDPWLARPCWNHVMTQQEPLPMPLEEAMRTQRAIRRIKSDPVDDSLVLHLLELATKAPTGSNAQNWEFIVVKDREVVAKLARLNRRFINLVGPIGKCSFERRGDEKMLGLAKAVQWQADHFDEIPVVVVACLKGVIPTLAWPSVVTTSAYGSIYPAVQNLLLAARAAGWARLSSPRRCGAGSWPDAPWACRGMSLPVR